MPLQQSFQKPAFLVTTVVVNPVEDKRGLVTGYNLVAQGKANHEQQIVGHYDAAVEREFLNSEAETLKSEFTLN